MSQISWIFCALGALLSFVLFLYLPYSLTPWLSFLYFSTLLLMPDILCSISYHLFIRLTSEVSFWHLKFFLFPVLFQFEFSLVILVLYLILFSCLELFSLCHLVGCIFTDLQILFISSLGSLDIIITVILKPLSFHHTAFLGTYYNGVTGGDILSCLFMFMSLN